LRLSPVKEALSRMSLELKLAARDLPRSGVWQGEAEYAHGLPWEVQRFSLCDMWRAELRPGWLLTLGTVGSMYTSFDGPAQLAGVRQLSPATFPGFRIRPPMLAPFEVGAGFLMSVNRAFQPDKSWGVFELSGRI
jgi:hypothetical protein